MKFLARDQRAFAPIPIHRDSPLAALCQHRTVAVTHNNIEPEGLNQIRKHYTKPFSSYNMNIFKGIYTYEIISSSF